VITIFIPEKADLAALTPATGELELVLCTIYLVPINAMPHTKRQKKRFSFFITVYIYFLLVFLPWRLPFFSCFFAV